MCLFPISVRTQYLKQHFIAGTTSFLVQMPKYRVVPCGKCYDCRRSKASAWRFRLFKEMQLGGHKNSIFVTLTLSDDYYTPDTDPALYIRRFLDRLRKEFGHSLKHWFTHEYGTDRNGTHRLHFHGILWDWPDPDRELHRIQSNPDKDLRQYMMRSWNDRHLAPLWSYGFTVCGHTCDIGTALYITKYITKGYFEYYTHPEVWKFPPRIYCSAGIGIAYLPSVQSRRRALRHGPIYDSIGVCRYRVPDYFTRKSMSFTDSFVRQLHSPPLPIEENPRAWFARGVHWKTYEEYAAIADQDRRIMERAGLGPKSFREKRNQLWPLRTQLRRLPSKPRTSISPLPALSRLCRV